MRYACSTWNFEEEIMEGKLDLIGVVKEIKKIGFNAVEIMGYHLPSMEEDELAAFANQMKELDMKVTAIDARNQMFGGKWFEYRRDISMIKLWIYIASKINCPTVVVFPGSFETEEKRLEQAARDVEGIRECVAYADKLGVNISIENHRIYAKQNEMENEDEAGDIIRIIETIGAKNCGAAPDSDNFFKAAFAMLSPEKQEATYRDFERLVKHANHVHIKVKNFDDNGMSLQTDMKRLVSIIKENRYTGDISFELMKPVEDKRDVLAKGLRLLKKELQQ